MLSTAYYAVEIFWKAPQIKYHVKEHGCTLTSGILLASSKDSLSGNKSWTREQILASRKKWEEVLKGLHESTELSLKRLTIVIWNASTLFLLIIIAFMSM